MAFHGFRLFASSPHRFSQFYSLIKVNAKLSKCDHCENSREDYDPPVACFLLLL
jgi:hypothetical protein